MIQFSENFNFFGKKLILNHIFFDHQKFYFSLKILFFTKNLIIHDKFDFSPKFLLFIEIENFSPIFKKNVSISILAKIKVRIIGQNVNSSDIRQIIFNSGQ